MKTDTAIRKKGDNKGKLKTRNVSGILDGEPHVFKIRPYAREIEPAKWSVPDKVEPKKKARFKKSGVK